MERSGATKQLRERVLDRGLCAHCGACVNLCPYYISYDDGVVVRDECTRAEGGCLDVCPREPTDLRALSSLLFRSEDMTPELGAVRAFHVTRAADEGIRRGAQHGGTVTALVGLALESALVDAAVVSGMTNPLSPSPTALTEAGQASASRGSRFVTTPSVSKFNELAKGDATSIGVVATPCQALALAKMKRSRNPRVQEKGRKIGLVIGLFCGWALSSSALTALLAGRVDAESIIGMDIPPSQYHRLEVFTSGGTVSISLDEVLECVRPSCHSCQDMTAEFADVSVGSARLPGGWEEARSWNQLIVRTDRGQHLVELARSRGVLEFREAPVGNLERLKKAALNKKRTGAKELDRQI